MESFKEDLRQRLEYAGSWGFLNLVRSLPISAGRLGAEGLAYLANHGLEFRRELVEGNIRRAFPDRDEKFLRKVRDECYQFFARATIEWLHLEKILQEKTIEEEGWEHLDRREGEGVIIVSGHIGYWELACAILGDRYDKFTAYADQQENPYTEELIQDVRGGYDIEPASKGFTGIKGLLERLKAGEYVGLLADQHVRNTYKYVPFFGEEVRVPRILSFLARKTECPVIPMYAVATGPEKVSFRIFSPLTASMREGQPEESELLREYNQWLEDQIRKFPEQYFWFHDRWQNSMSIEK